MHTTTCDVSNFLLNQPEKGVNELLLIIKFHAQVYFVKYLFFSLRKLQAICCQCYCSYQREPNCFCFFDNGSRGCV